MTRAVICIGRLIFHGVSQTSLSLMRKLSRYLKYMYIWNKDICKHQHRRTDSIPLLEACWSILQINQHLALFTFFVSHFCHVTWCIWHLFKDGKQSYFLFLHFLFWNYSLYLIFLLVSVVQHSEQSCFLISKCNASILWLEK